MGRLPEGSRRAIQQSYNPSRPYYPSRPMAVDAHCHLRKLKKREGEDRMRDIGGATRDQLGVMAVVDSACFQKDWMTSAWNLYPRAAIYQAVGLHPTEVPKCRRELNQILEKATEAASQCRVVAVGEVGIDLHHQDSEAVVEMQSLDLDYMARHAWKHRLPLVIHARDNGSGRANEICRGVIRKAVGRQQKSAWEREFPQVMLSLSAILMGHNCHPELHDIIRSLPLNKLLLETDSPFLCPPGVKARDQCPASIVKVAARVGELRRLPRTLILEATALNARSFFRIGMSPE